MVCKSCCREQKKVKKGLWSPEEDRILKSYVLKYGHGCWSEVPKLTGLDRCGKSCRLRWINYLRPGVKRGDFSPQEQMMVLNAHAILGNRWSRIASMIPGRTDNDVKNFWNSHLKKKLNMFGINQNVHGPPGECSREEILEQTSTNTTGTQTNFNSEGRLNLESSTSRIPLELTTAMYDKRSIKSEIGFADINSNSISECSARETVTFSEWWNSPQDEKSKSNVDFHMMQMSSQSAIELENCSGECFQPRFHSLSQCPTHTEIENIISSEFAPGVCTANVLSDGPSESMSWDLPTQWSLQSDGSIFSNDFSTSWGNTNTIDITEQGHNVGSMGISIDVNLRIDDDPKLFENCASLYWEFC